MRSKADRAEHLKRPANPRFSGGDLAAAAVGIIVVIAGCATAPTTPPATQLDFPSPVEGPGGPPVDKGQQRQLKKGWDALTRGDVRAARATATGAGSAGQLLALQASVVAGDQDPIPGLRKLTETSPQYASAWLTLSVAAEDADNESLALEAAQRGAELWSDGRWEDRSRRLRQRWIEDRVESARRIFEASELTEALDTLEPALALEPDNHDGVLLKAQVLIALDDPDRAEAALAALPRDNDVIRMSGTIAEARGDLSAAMRIYRSLPDDPLATLFAAAIAESTGDWLSAMNLYSSLPDDQPEKGPGLRAAQLRWRVSVMPQYVQEALSSPELDREDLAVVLVSLAPKVETLEGGQVPLLSDIMTLPSQNEILTAVRLGLLGSDRLEHRFMPYRLATPEGTRAAIDRLTRLLDLAGPRWCTTPDEVACTTLEAPISGEKVGSIVIDLMARDQR
jgi:tetratricopeptide (TPR) repeat protein